MTMAVFQNLRIIFCHSHDRLLEIAKKANMITGIRQNDIQERNKKYGQFLDNDFKRPSLKNFIELLEEIKPKIAVLPDVYSRKKVSKLLDVYNSFPDIDFIFVPKCDCFDILPVNATIAYPIPNKFSAGNQPIWRFLDFNVHILGGTTPLQYKLSSFFQVVSVDSNSFCKVARYSHKAFHAEKPHWRRHSELDFYKLVEISCNEIVKFWRVKIDTMQEKRNIQ